MPVTQIIKLSGKQANKAQKKVGGGNSLEEEGLQWEWKGVNQGSEG